MVREPVCRTLTILMNYLRLIPGCCRELMSGPCSRRTWRSSGLVSARPSSHFPSTPYPPLPDTPSRFPWSSLRYKLRARLQTSRPEVLGSSLILVLLLCWLPAPPPPYPLARIRRHDDYPRRDNDRFDRDRVRRGLSRAQEVSRRARPRFVPPLHPAETSPYGRSQLTRVLGDGSISTPLLTREALIPFSPLTLV